MTSHRRGRLPILRDHRTSLPLLTALVIDLVGREETESLAPHLARLYRVHRGNLRDCLRGLYDLWAQRAPVSRAAATASTGS